MKKQCSLPFDRISNLPSHISESILMSLPLRDMARTSILSKSWRYQWLKVPQLVFKDDPNYLVSQEERYRYSAKKVLKILLLHHGPILKFTLDMTAWSDPDCSEIDSIIPFLSGNGIKELTLLMPNKAKKYKLSSSILSCVELRHLSLSSCVIQPLTSVAFNKLVTLELSNVKLDSDVSISSCPFLESLVLLNILSVVNSFSIDAPRLNKLNFEGSCLTRFGIMNTPLLKVLCLYGDEECCTGNSSFELISILHSLPLLEDLCLCNGFLFLQVLAMGDSLNKLSKCLYNLAKLDLLYVDLTHMGELSSSLWFIRSSPNLRKLKLTLYGPWFSHDEAELYLKMQEHSNRSLSELQEVEIELVHPSSNLRPFIELAKLLLDISPVLGTLYIKPDLKCIGVNGYKRLFELACYPRASPKAKIVCVGLESLNLTIG